jgi:hypothetical protein
MAASEYPVTVAVRRPDGSVEHVRVGTAVRVGESFRLSLGELSIGGEPVAASGAQRRAAPMPPPPSDGGFVFPPYGRSKGMPVSGATMQDLEYYAGGCRRTLSDPGKARWHDKERQLLSAIEAEIARQGGGSPARGGRSDDLPSFRDDDAPPRMDEDLPF